MKQRYKTRRDKLAATLRQHNLDAVAVLPGPDFHYLTGLDFLLIGRPTMIFITASGELLALLPELERLKWREHYPDAPTFFWQDSDGYSAAFDSAAAALGASRLGIEYQRMRVFEVDELSARLGRDALCDAGAILEHQRMVKEPSEIACVEKALRITETAFAETLASIRTGQTELAIRRLLSVRILENGADGLGFEPLVLFAGNSANPHGTSGERRLRPGDPILIGCSARVEGYHATLGRTVFCEFARDEHAEIQETVANSSVIGLAAVRPGISAHQLNEQVMAPLRASKFAEMIVHRAGHGCGLGIYEPPHIQENNPEPLCENSIIILEPALYRRDEIGVRIEDFVLVRAGEPQLLTQFSRELIIVGN